MLISNTEHSIKNLQKIFMKPDVLLLFFTFHLPTHTCSVYPKFQQRPTCPDRRNLSARKYNSILSSETVTRGTAQVAFGRPGAANRYCFLTQEIGTINIEV